MIIDGEWEKDVESSLPQEEPDFEEEEYWKHRDDVHGGGECNCRPPTQAELDAQWAEADARHRAEVHEGGPCDCESPF